MPKSAILVVTHFISEVIAQQVNRLRAESPDDHDVYLLINLDEEKTTPEQRSLLAGISTCFYSNKIILELPYPNKCKPMGWNGLGWSVANNADAVILRFFKDFPNYDYYWGIEYDVHYEGKWHFLFDRFRASEADLLACMIYPATAIPYKVKMPPPFHDEKGQSLTPEEAHVSFLPIYRTSNRMMKTLDQEYRAGWSGHYELTFPTIALRHGLILEDIGGKGPYTKPHNLNVFYFNNVKRWDMSPGTFVFRPPFARILKKPNTLWHPLKPSGNYFNHCPGKEEDNLYGWAKFISKFFLYRILITLWFWFIWRPATTSIPSNPKRLEAQAAAKE